MTADLKPILKQLQARQPLSRAQAADVMEVLVSGQADPTQAGAILMALSLLGETADEIIGMVEVMRQHMTTVDLGVPVLDTCGTGGDHQNTFNISTTTALVCAALDVPVAKHGNRAASSKSGSADVLAELGVPTDLKPTAAKKYFVEHNFVFMFAPLYHPGMKAVIPIRQALGIRTIFNFLGPLLNPAQATYQLIGVSDPGKAELIGKVLLELGSQHVVVVYSDDGLDEVSCAAGTNVVDCLPTGIRRFHIEPDQRYPLLAIQVDSAQSSAQVIRSLADNEASVAVIQTVAMNAGLALYAANRADSYEAGKHQAEVFLRGNGLKKYLSHL